MLSGSRLVLRNAPSPRASLSPRPVRTFCRVIDKHSNPLPTLLLLEHRTLDPRCDRLHRPNMNNILLTAQSRVGLAAVAIFMRGDENVNGNRRLANVVTAIICLAMTSLAKPSFALTTASDNASDPAYVDGWQVGDNGGIGFGPWNLAFSGDDGSAYSTILSSSITSHWPATHWVHQHSH